MEDTDNHDRPKTAYELEAKPFSIGNLRGMAFALLNTARRANDLAAWAKALDLLFQLDGPGIRVEGTGDRSPAVDPKG